MTTPPPKASDPVLPVEPEIVATEPLKPAPTVEADTSRKWWQIWKPRQKKPKRPLLLRLFGIGLWGSFKLIMLCVIVGFILLAMQFDPTSPSFDASETLGRFLQNAWAAGRWAVTNFWKPALSGAALVLPIWVLWRLISLPFRR